VAFSFWSLFKTAPQQFQHNRLLQSQGPMDLISYENKVGEFQNPYLLHEISSQQIKRQRWKKLEETLVQLEKSLKGWRDVEFRRGLLEMIKGNLGSSKEKALHFQEKYDTYYDINIKLLLDLSRRLNDFDLFRRQIQLSIERLALSNGFGRGSGPSLVTFLETEKPVLFDFKEVGEKLTIFWNKNMWKNIFVNGAFNKSMTNEIMGQIFNSTRRISFFKVKPREFKTDKVSRRRLGSLAGQYFNKKRERDLSFKKLTFHEKREMGILNKEHQRKETFSFLRKVRLASLSKEQSQKRLTLSKEWEAKLGPLEDQLEQLAFWSDFKKRADFRNSLMQKLHVLLFPREQG